MKVYRVTEAHCELEKGALLLCLGLPHLEKQVNGKMMLVSFIGVMDDGEQSDYLAAEQDKIEELSEEDAKREIKNAWFLHSAEKV